MMCSLLAAVKIFSLISPQSWAHLINHEKRQEKATKQRSNNQRFDKNSCRIMERDQPFERCATNCSSTGYRARNLNVQWLGEASRTTRQGYFQTGLVAIRGRCLPGQESNKNLNSRWAQEAAEPVRTSAAWASLVYSWGNHSKAHTAMTTTILPCIFKIQNKRSKVHNAVACRG